MIDHTEPRLEPEAEGKRSYETPKVEELGDLAELTAYSVSVRV